MRKLIVVLTSFFIMFSATVHADDVATSVVREGISAAFTEMEKQMIKRYFGEHVQYKEKDEDHEHDYDKKGKKYKNKKHKNKGLPPGIAKKLERGGSLPPGIAKRYLPDDLKYDLPKPPHGYERTIVDNDVVLVEVDTGKIADIITGVILGE